MNRMNAENLTIGVGIWYSGNITNHDRNRMVLDRVMDIINYLASLVPETKALVKERVEEEVFEVDPINSHKYPEFFARPEPAPSAPYDMRVDKLLGRMKEITDIIDDIEAKSIHELTFHTYIGKVLQIVYCMLNKVPYTAKRAKTFFLKENFVDLLKEFDPNRLQKRKIKELQKLLNEFPYSDLDKIEKVSHSAVLIIEYIKLVTEVLKDVDKPEPLEKPVEVEPPITEALKKVVYYPLPKKKRKEGVFMQMKEMVIDENDRVSPVKIAINVRDASIVNLNFGQLDKVHELRHKRFVSLERNSSSFRFLVNKSQDLTPNPSSKYKNSQASLKSKKRIKNYSLRTIDLNKKSQFFSKISLEASKKTIGISSKSIINEEELIDKVLNLTTSRADVSFSQDHTSSDHEILKSLPNSEIEKQPMSVLLKFAEILKTRRETHSLL